MLDGFATTADAYRPLIANESRQSLRALLSGFDPENLDELARSGHAGARRRARDAAAASCVGDARRYERLCAGWAASRSWPCARRPPQRICPKPRSPAQPRRSSTCAVAKALLRAVHACFASLFTDRAISYRARLGYDQLKVALSVGVMPMVRSDMASSGVIFTLDTESGFRDAVVVTGAYGLGEFVVQGVVTPDEWTVFKPTLATGPARSSAAGSARRKCGWSTPTAARARAASPRRRRARAASASAMTRC